MSHLSKSTSHDEDESFPLSSSSSSSSSSLSQVCPMLIPQLLSSNLLDKSNNCTFCRQSLVHHQQTIHQQSGTVVSSSNTAATVPGLSKSKLNKNIISELPKWKKQYKLCTPFFNSLEMLFSVHDVTDESLFKKYLQLSLSDLPDFEQLYAHTHITSDASLSWSQVKSLFSQRFESHDHINQLKRQYRHLKYTHDDNIQSFSHRFINLCTELSYDIDSSPIIDNFLSLLPSDMHRRFSMQCQYRQTTISSYQSLDDIIKDITLLENSYNNAQHFYSPNNINNNNNYNNNDRATKYVSSKTVSFQKLSKGDYHPSSSSSSSSSPKKYCKNHPGITSHTTAECRLTTPQKHSSSSSSSTSSTSSSTFKSRLPSPQPVCYNCGTLGHKSPDCSKPKVSLSSGRISSGTSNTGANPRQPLSPLARLLESAARRTRRSARQLRSAEAASATGRGGRPSWRCRLCADAA